MEEKEEVGWKRFWNILYVIKKNKVRLPRDKNGKYDPNGEYEEKCKVPNLNI